LGYVWSLMRPLLFFGVLYVFFVTIIHIAKAPPLWVLPADPVALWSCFAEATGNYVPLLGRAKRCCA
jgi:ABC-2 type transport system permease protein